jgi:hypothetical protein
MNVFTYIHFVAYVRIVKMHRQIETQLHEFIPIDMNAKILFRV